MKKKFRGYYRLNPSEIKKIWTNGFIAFDTNVLFNFYRYSHETRRELVRVIKKSSDHIWIPYHVAYEYHKNRINVISREIGIYEDNIKRCEELKYSIITKNRNPHISKKNLSNLKKILDATIKDLNNRKNYYTGLLSNDTILNTITKIFNNKIGNGFDKEKIKQLEKETEIRFKDRIPPGYKDSGKDSNSYGDLIIWFELKEASKVMKKPFIFVCDDFKEDWWLKTKGRKLGPRYELLQELYLEAGQFFHIYTTDRFLEIESQQNDVNQTAIKEIREVREEKNLENEDDSYIAMINAINNLRNLMSVIPSPLSSFNTNVAKNLSGLQKEFVLADNKIKNMLKLMSSSILNVNQNSPQISNENREITDGDDSKDED